MSRINDLLHELRSREPALASDLESEVAALADRRAFGLNFERHVPEAVELPGRKVRAGDKVRELPPRADTTNVVSDNLWRVLKVDRQGRTATLEELVSSLTQDYDPEKQEPKRKSVSLDDIIVVAESRDPIYPGLVSTGVIERGDDKPFHTVINAENLHALETLLFTHRNRVDCIYIDPPYNTGAKDWKYNNDYIEGDDLYRHSKWLAFMERRLHIAKKLLNNSNSVLIVTIDEKEYLRLGLLLEQTFPEATIQMITTSIKPSGSQRSGEFSRVEEYVYFVMFGDANPASHISDMLRDGANPDNGSVSVTWHGLRRRGSTDWKRSHRPNGFYPIHVSETDGKLVSVGDPLPADMPKSSYTPPENTYAAWPLDPNGEESRWQISPTRLKEQLANGTAVLRKADKESESASIVYLKGGDLKRIASGEITVIGRDEEGKVLVEGGNVATRRPKTMWLMESHDASAHGTALLTRFLPGRRFPFPKSLYAVEDALRFFVKDKPQAVIVDFFAGSGTTAHAVMRLNRQDDGSRQAILVTNNEVAADEQKSLSKEGLRPGDADWEKWGICEFITKPRIRAAIEGKTHEETSIEGAYKFTDEFPMSEGFSENAEFLTLTYEAPLRVASNREFRKIAPLLWLRAGSQGPRIEDVSEGWAVAKYYGVLANLDKCSEFLESVAASKTIRIAYIVTDEDRLFESIARELADHIEPVRLYEAYLRNFEIESSRGSI